MITAKLVLKNLWKSFLIARNSRLPSVLKREVIRGVWVLDRINIKRRSSINLIGYHITFLGEASFRYLFAEIFVNEVYLFETDTDKPVIFDCGSNIGMSVLFFKKLYPYANITAFEPDPSTFAVLDKNIKDNVLSGVTAHQVALGGRDGMVDFYRDDDEKSSSLLMSTLRNRHKGRHIKVPIKRLSSFVDSEIDLLKIDIEGAETDLIRDLVTTGKLRNARRIHLEYHHHIESERDSLSVVLGLLEGAGFGYQIRSEPDLRAPEGSFQDIAIYCYRKEKWRPSEDGSL
jgi:FkbM family methyltransferase